MNKHIKKILACLLTFTTIIAGTCGCGSNKQGAEIGAAANGANGDAYVYVPETIEADLGFSYLVKAIEKDDVLYLLGNTWDEATKLQTNHLVKYTIKDNKQEEIPLTLDADYSVAQMMLNADGNLLIAVYRMDENAEKITNLELIEMSTDGSVINQKDITASVGNTETSYVQYLCHDKEGNIYISTGEPGVVVLNKDFSLKTKVSVTDWLLNMEMSQEGDVYATSFAGTGYSLYKVDIEKNTMVKSDKIEAALSRPTLYMAKDSSFLLGDATALSKFNMETGEKQQVLEWLKVDIDSSQIAYLGQFSDDSIWLMYNKEDFNSTDTKFEITHLNKVKASETVQKETIYYGAVYLDDAIKKYIVDFNKNNDKYRVEVKDYASADMEEGRNRLNADVANGCGPDLIDLAAVRFSEYNKNGILEDLNPYFEKSGLNKADYLENAFSCYEYEGKQFGIVPRFIISTMIVKSSKVDGKTGWTLTEMMEFVQNEKTDKVFSYEDRSTILSTCIYENLDDFVDWESGKCSFDDDIFKSVLAFASQFPKDTDYSQEQNITTMIREDRVLVVEASIYTCITNQLMKQVFNEDITYIGCPDSERKGNRIYPFYGSCGIYGQSPNKDGAWAFMEYMLSEETQREMALSTNHMGFPVRKDELDECLKAETQPESGPITYTSNYYEDLYEVTPSKVDADEIRELIYSAKGVIKSKDSDMIDIITEEAEAYFEGQKSIEDTVSVIQNRVQTYVNEKR